MGKDCLGVVIADAAGHGIGPAITMSETRAVIRTLATIFQDVGEILTRAGAILAKDLTEKTFVALFLARLDASSRTVQFAAAGHSGLVLDASGRTKRLLKTPDPPLGIPKGQEYSASAEIPLEANESLFLFTDGLTERQNRSGGHFGNRRLIEAVQARYSHGAQQMLEHIFHEVKAFAQGKRPSDDMTAVIVKVGYPVGTQVDVQQEKPLIAPLESYDHFNLVEREGTIVLHLTDIEILSTQTCADLQGELVNYVHSEKPSQLVVSLRDVARFSSEAINVFLRLKKALAAEQTAFKLCEMQPQIREAFKALNLDGGVFEIHNDIQDALKSF
jgi:anti-anti-sigma regulatory factor